MEYRLSEETVGKRLSAAPRKDGGALGVDQLVKAVIVGNRKEEFVVGMVKDIAHDFVGSHESDTRNGMLSGD